MAAIPYNPFPLNIVSKIDSWDKLQLLQYMDPSLKLEAAEINKIVQALNWLYNQTNGGTIIDGIIQLGNLTIVADPLNPSGVAVKIPIIPLPVWRIAGTIHTKLTETYISIPAAASDKYRIDFVVANSSNTFQRVAGEERSDVGIPPQLPENVVFISEVHIFGDIVDTPIPSPQGYIRKTSKKYRSITLLDVEPKVMQVSSEYTTFLIKNAAGSGLVAGFTTASISQIGDVPHDGMDIYIKNFGPTAFTLQHNNIADAEIPFFFYNGLDLEVPVGAILHFKYNIVGRVELVGNSESFPEKTGRTITFTHDKEYTSPLIGDIIIDPTGAVPGTYLLVHVNSDTEPSITGGTSIMQTGSFAVSRLNLYHFLWSNAGGYSLAIQSVPQTFTSLDFTTLGMLESPDNVFENTSGSTYVACYGVSTETVTGDFIYKIQISDSDCYGSMFGLSTFATNRSYNNATPWKFMAFCGALAPIGKVYQAVDGGTIANPLDTPTDIIAGVGVTMELRRISNDVKLYANGIEIHHFGTLSGAVYLHISTFLDKFIKYPQVTIL